MVTERPTTPEASQPFGQDNELGGNGADEEPHGLHHNLKQLIHDLIDTNFAKFIARSFNSEEWIRQQELFQDPNLASFVSYIVAAIQQLYTILGAFASQFGFKHRTVHYMLLTAHTHTAKAIFRETNRWNFLEHELRSEWQVGWNRMDYIKHVKNRMNEAEQWEQDEWDAEIQRREDNFEKGKVPPIIQRKRVNRMVKGMKACVSTCRSSYTSKCRLDVRRVRNLRLVVSLTVSRSLTDKRTKSASNQSTCSRFRRLVNNFGKNWTHMASERTHGERYVRRAACWRLQKMFQLFVESPVSS
jgi:hypothetical protein